MTPATASGRIQAYFLIAMALLLAGLMTGRNLANWPIRLGYPGEENFNEGVQLAEMVRLRQGVRIYRPASPGQFDPANYGPLYYLLGARLVNPEAPSYFPLRMVSLVGTLGCGAGCAVLAFWLAGSALSAILAALVFLSYGFVSLYGLSVRCDLVGVCLMFWGFLVAYRFRHSGALLAAVPLMLLGFFYKQQFVAGPLAVLIFLLLERRTWLATRFVGLLGAGGLGLLGLFQFAVFRRQAFLAHFLLYNMQPFFWPLFRQLAFVFAAVLLIPLLLGIELLRSYTQRLLTCYLGCAVVLGLVTAGKQGSDVNYFLESVLILSALAPALLVKRLEDPARAGVVLLGLALTVFLAQWPTSNAPRPQDFARDRAVHDYLRQHFPPHTRAFSLFTGDLIRAGLDLPLSDLFIYTWLTRQGILSDRELLAELGDRRFGVILVNFNLERNEPLRYSQDYLTKAVRQAIVARYHVAASLEMPAPEKIDPDDRFYVWAPNY